MYWFLKLNTVSSHLYCKCKCQIKAKILMKKTAFTTWWNTLSEIPIWFSYQIISLPYNFVRTYWALNANRFCRFRKSFANFFFFFFLKKRQWFSWRIVLYCKVWSDEAHEMSLYYIPILQRSALQRPKKANEAENLAKVCPKVVLPSGK